MTPERWRRVREVFDEAVECSTAERPSFLDRATAGDPDLRAEVDSLLESYDASEDFLAEPPARLGEALGGGEEESLEGSEIGPYRLLRRMRLEGASPVYLAERATGERFAVKLLPTGLDSLVARQRLQTERRTLEALDHPGVIRPLESAIAPDGRPYLVLEAFEGAPIDRWCDERRLPIAGRLRLFSAACDAVQHAHWRLVIHLAIGPETLLVDREGRLKLVDFSAAAPLRLGDAGADAVSTALDVGALGVVLYRLLCGGWPGAEPRPPSEALLGGTAAAEIAACRASTPGKLAGELLGDLDAIAMLALGREAGHRYPTAHVLRDDLSRYLDNLPVRARRPTLGYLIDKGIGRAAARARRLLGR
jgi:serine/threonine protein kinase